MTPDNEVLARALATSTHADVATQFSISRATLSRKLRSQSFRASVKARQEEIVSEMVSTTLASCALAVERLQWLAANASSESVQATSAKTLLDQARQWFEIGSLSQGLAEVNAQLAETKKKEQSYGVRAA